MLVAKEENRNYIIARSANKDVCYYCPECNQKLMLKQGSKNIHHFSHYNVSNCSRGGESIEHSEGKYKIYDELKSKGYEVYLEKKIGNRIADVYCTDLNCIYEIQHSKISVEDYKSRTDDYYKNGKNVVWVVDSGDKWADGYFERLENDCFIQQLQALKKANYKVQYNNLKKILTDDQQKKYNLESIYYYAKSQMSGIITLFICDLKGVKYPTHF